MAPEVLASSQATPYDGFKADIFSLGVILFVMLAQSTWVCGLYCLISVCVVVVVVVVVGGCCCFFMFSHLHQMRRCCYC